MVLFVGFLVFMGLVYLLSRGVSWALNRLRVTPTVEAMTRVFLGLALAVALIFVMRGLQALSLP